VTSPIGDYHSVIVLSVVDNDWYNDWCLVYYEGLTSVSSAKRASEWPSEALPRRRSCMEIEEEQNKSALGAVHPIMLGSRLQHSVVKDN